MEEKPLKNKKELAHRMKIHKTWKLKVKQKTKRKWSVSLLRFQFVYSVLASLCLHQFISHIDFFLLSLSSILHATVKQYRAIVVLAVVERCRPRLTVFSLILMVHTEHTLSRLYSIVRSDSWLYLFHRSILECACKRTASQQLIRKWCHYFYENICGHYKCVTRALTFVRALCVSCSVSLYAKHMKAIASMQSFIAFKMDIFHWNWTLYMTEIVQCTRPCEWWYWFELCFQMLSLNDELFDSK